MSPAFDHSETTLVFEHSSQTVELYTTSRSLWLRAIKRNPNFLEAVSLEPGYLLTYSMDDVRAPEMILRPEEGGAEKQKYYLTPQELQTREQQAERFVERLARSKS